MDFPSPKINSRSPVHFVVQVSRWRGGMGRCLNCSGRGVGAGRVCIDQPRVIIFGHSGFRTQHGHPSLDYCSGQAHCNVTLFEKLRFGGLEQHRFEPLAVGAGFNTRRQRKVLEMLRFCKLMTNDRTKICVRSSGIRSSMASTHDSGTLQNTAFSFRRWPRKDAKVKTSNCSSCANRRIRSCKEISVETTAKQQPGILNQGL